MTFFASLRRDRVRTTGAARKLRPGVEACESRKLMSGATVSGTAFQDLSGDGTFTDTARLPGVTINLYQGTTTKVVEHTVTDKNGNFSFTNVPAGSYTVQQVDPTNFIPTGANFGYPVTLKNGQSATQKDFEDFQITPLPVLSQVSYTITTPAGKSTTVTSFGNAIQEGDTVTAHFTLKSPAVISLVAYKAPNGTFNTTNLQEQVVYSQETTTFSAGEGNAASEGAQRILPG